MKRHVFLTGEKRTGKSTLLRAVLSQFRGINTGGFETYFLKAADGRSLYIGGWGEKQRPGEENRVALFPGTGQKFVFPEVFNSVGAGLVEAAAGKDLIVMDECGFLEREAKRFTGAVLRTLGGDTPVFGVVRLDEGEWIRSLREHPRVLLYTVTTENREELRTELFERLSILLKAKPVI